MTVRDRVIAAFAKAHGRLPDLIASAPGRVNLIGEHTDYNDGFVLPMAIQHGTWVAAGRREDRRIEVNALDYAAQDGFALDAIPHADTEWANYVRGVVVAMQSRGHKIGGADLIISGDVPQGAGLSSSASLTVAIAKALSALHLGDALDGTELALIAQAAENDFVGCACGIMDQLVSARAEAGAALLIDCRSLGTRAVPIPGDWRVLVVHSGVTRGLVDSAYNERRAQCETVAAACDVAALRDLDMAALETARDRLDPVAFARARHVVTENARTLEAATALEAGDLHALSALMAASHASMRDDFAITVPKIDELVAILQDAARPDGGARMTGGGFGGCVVAVVRADAEARVRAALAQRYRTPGGETALVIACQASAGAAIA